MNGLNKLVAWKREAMLEEEATKQGGGSDLALVMQNLNYLHMIGV